MTKKTEDNEGEEEEEEEGEEEAARPTPYVLTAQVEMPR